MSLRGRPQLLRRHIDLHIDLEPQEVDVSNRREDEKDERPHHRAYSLGFVPSGRCSGRQGSGMFGGFGVGALHGVIKRPKKMRV